MDYNRKKALATFLVMAMTAMTTGCSFGNGSTAKQPAAAAATEQQGAVEDVGEAATEQQTVEAVGEATTGSTIEETEGTITLVDAAKKGLTLDDVTYGYDDENHIIGTEILDGKKFNLSDKKVKKITVYNNEGAVDHYVLKCDELSMVVTTEQMNNVTEGTIQGDNIDIEYSFDLKNGKYNKLTYELVPGGSKEKDKRNLIERESLEVATGKTKKYSNYDAEEYALTVVCYDVDNNIEYVLNREYDSSHNIISKVYSNAEGDVYRIQSFEYIFDPDTSNKKNVITTTKENGHTIVTNEEVIDKEHSEILEIIFDGVNVTKEQYDNLLKGTIVDEKGNTIVCAIVDGKYTETYVQPVEVAAAGITEQPTEGETEVAAAGVTEQPTEGETEVAAAGVTEQPTERETEVAAAGVTEQPTEGETEVAVAGVAEQPAGEVTDGATAEANEQQIVEPPVSPMGIYTEEVAERREAQLKEQSSVEEGQNSKAVTEQPTEGETEVAAAGVTEQPVQEVVGEPAQDITGNEIAVFAGSGIYDGDGAVSRALTSVDDEFNNLVEAANTEEGLAKLSEVAVKIVEDDINFLLADGRIAEYTIVSCSEDIISKVCSQVDKVLETMVGLDSSFVEKLSPRTQNALDYLDKLDSMTLEMRIRLREAIENELEEQEATLVGSAMVLRA